MEYLRIGYYLILLVYFTKCYLKERVALDWLLILSAVGVHAYYFWGLNGIVFLIAVGIVSTVAELVSLKTPLNIFGVPYRYNLKSGYFVSKIVIAGVYPLDITAAWILLKYLSFFLSLIIGEYFGLGNISRAVLSAVILVFFDLVIDPLAVSDGAWIWSKKGQFMGVPWQNFLGWFWVGVAASFLPINLAPITAIDYIMAMPVVVVTALIAWSLGSRLIRRNLVMGIVACVPLAITVILGMLSVMTG